MATLNVNGQNVQVDDAFLKLPHDQQQATVEEIASSMKPARTESFGEDAAKSIGSGLGSATISTLGSAGDARDLLSRGVDAIGNKVGVDLSPLKKVASMSPLGALNAAPTSAQIKSTVTDPIVSPDYEPKYEFNRFLKKGAEFAPAALLGGPEGVGSKLLTNVAAPAIASEIGGKIAGPYGELAGALVGGGGATAAARKFQEMAAARAASKAVPTAEDILKTADSQFEAVKASDAIIKPAAVEQMAQDIKTELLNEGKHPTIGNQGGVFSALDRMEAMANKPGGVTTKDMEVIRKNLTAAKMDADGSTREAARQAVTSLMDKYSNIAQTDLLHGSLPTQDLKDAIGNWAAGKRSNTITGKVDLADLNAGTAGSGANQDNALRQAIKQLARPQNNTNIPVAKKLGFNDTETAAIRQAATGTAVGNTARYLGKYAPTGIVSAAGGAGLGHLIGGPIGAAIPAVGYIAKKIGDLSTKRAVNALDSLVRSRSPLARQVAGQLPPQIANQLPAKTQRILQSLPTQPSPPSLATSSPPIARPPRSAPIPSPQFSPIFAPPKPMIPAPPVAPFVTAAADGQPPRPSRVGMGEDVRLRKYQDWTAGRIVKVGFVDGLKVEGTVPPVYNGDAPGFILTKGDKVYRVTPHRGLEKLDTAEGKQLLTDARQQSGD